MLERTAKLRTKRPSPHAAANRRGYPKLPFVTARHGRTRDPIRTYTWLWVARILASSRVQLLSSRWTIAVSTFTSSRRLASSASMYRRQHVDVIA